MLNLINVLSAQAEVSDSDDALNRALDLLDEHEELFQDDGSRLAYLAKRGSALLMKAQRSRDPSVMREAVQVQRDRKKLAPKGHPQHALCLYDLGMTLLHSGTTSGRPDYLTEAVEVLKAAKRRPDSSVHPAAVLSALGNARLARIKRVKRQDKKKELDVALEAHRLAADAAETAEPGDPVIQACMADAAAALMRAYEETGDHRLLAASVDALRGAADATPDEHFRKAERLSNLAFALIALHEVTVNAETLDEAISTARAAVATADAGHAHRLSCLYALAYGLFRRAELRQMLIDADEAAIIADEVAHRTDQADTRWAMRQAFRAQAMCYLPTAVKLRRADEDLAAAAGRLRHDDPDRALIVSNRGALMEAIVGFLDSTTEEGRQRAEQAVQLTKEAADATPPDHSEYPVRLLNFVLASTTLARLQRDPDVLDIPLGMCEATQGDLAAQGAWGTMLELGYAGALACRYELSGNPDTAAAAMAAYRHGTSDIRVDGFRRLEAARAGARFAASCNETGPSLELYGLAIDLLGTVIWRGIDRRDQERLLARYAELPSDAAAIAITAGQPELAVEFLERGRGVLLGRLLDDSADITRLTVINPGQADRLAALQRDLDAIIMPDPEAAEFSFVQQPPEQASEADHRSALARQIDNLIEEIRALPGCGDLFTPPRFADLHAAIGGRTVAVLNISAYRCDAVIITSAGARTVPLQDLTRDNADDAARFFRTRAKDATQRGEPGEAARRALTTRLAWLWETVAGPVLQEAGMTGTTPAATSIPRLYWCPTGPSVFLPLHAAGHHQPTGTSAPLTVIDNTESVYIPKLRTLVPRYIEPAAGHKISPAPLIVSMPTTPGMPPLPAAQAEGDRLASIFTSTLHLSGNAATRSAVTAQMGTHRWYHFAVHGITDNDTPVNGGLELTDGRLTILDLLQLHLTDTQFAYLSACETHQNAPAIPDEAVTVATALHIAGCQTVAAALWQVADNHAADFAHQMYDRLITYQGETPLLRYEETPAALRETARATRDAHPAHPERWAAFVCTTY